MATVDELWDWIRPALQELRDAESGWVDWQRRLLGLLGLSRADEHPLTEELLKHLDELTEDDRARALEPDRLEELAYSMLQRHAEDAPQDEQDADDDYDEAAWHAFLAANGPAWDGSAESWSAFREWLSYQAKTAGVGKPTTELLDHLEDLDPDERITELAEYGVIISAAAEPAGSAAPDSGMDVLYERIRALPGIELLSEPEIAQIVERTLQEMGS